MLLKGKWVLVKQESLLWWHVLRWGEVIWPVAGPVYVRNVSWTATCVLCRGENTKDSGLCRIHVKIINFTLYFSCITSARKAALKMQSSGGWSHWICHSMDNGVFWGWNNGVMKYLLGQKSISLYISLCSRRMKWGRLTPAWLHLQLKFATMLPLLVTCMGSPTPMQPLPSMPGPTDLHGPLVLTFPAVSCRAACGARGGRRR